MLKLKLVPEPASPVGAAGGTSDVFMIKCALGYSLATGFASLAGAFCLGASAVVVWCFLSVPVLLFILIMSGFREGEKESESEVSAD